MEVLQREHCSQSAELALLCLTPVRRTVGV